uniref:Ig-like domain-containing protein n=1 Tax=Xenopus tropicalis TaxID=8364 RepID=A0A6I8Q372_XENTR
MRGLPYLSVTSAPSVFPLIPCCGNVDFENSVTMGCLVTGYMADPLEIQWNDGSITTGIKTMGPVLSAADGLYTLSSQLTILASEWKNTTYRCKVVHNSTNTKQEKSLKECYDNLQVHPLPPTFHDLYFSRIAKITCLVSSMKTTENFNIAWEREKEGKLEFVTEDPVLHDNGTYSVVSVLSVCAEDWESREKFSCTVRSQDLPSPVKKTIFKQNGTPKAPDVYLLPPSPQEILQQEVATITCYIKGFYPKEIFVQWMQGSASISEDKFVNTVAMKNDDEQTYFLYSKLTIPAAHWNQGNTYTCIVGHEALPLYITQQSIDKSSGKPSHVNVTLVLSDAASTCY